MNSQIVVRADGDCFYNGNRYHCALGRSGIRTDKSEGDGATPSGVFLMRKVYYRPDKFSMSPETQLPCIPLSENDGWCDDESHSEYNTFVKLPYEGSHEKLWREDDLYDIIIPIGFNDNPAVSGLGSAIFIHIAQENYSPTAGCIAFSKENLLAILKDVSSSTEISISH